MTLAELIELRDAARSAYLAALKAAGYTVNLGGGSSRTVSRQAVEKLKGDFLFWQREVEDKESGQTGIRVRYGTASS